MFTARQPPLDINPAHNSHGQSRENIHVAADGGGNNTRAQLQRKDSAIQHISDVRPVLQQLLRGHDAIFQLIEQTTKVDREKIFYGANTLLALYMILGPGAGLLCNLIGFAYPAYQSVIAIRSERKDDDTQWLVYWTTFGCFSLLDFFAENIYRVFPFYWLAKLCFLLYLALPQTNGAHNLYVAYVDPAFDKLQPLIKAVLGRLNIGGR